MTKLINPEESTRDEFVVPPFPIEVYPKPIQEIIETYCDIMSLNADYCATTVLFAFSVAMGNNFKAKVKRGWVELPTLFISLVGKAGINKSAPLSIFTNPLEEMDKSFFRKYLEQFKEYQRLKEDGKKDKESKEIPEPVRKQLIIKDTTQEALLFALYHNPHGFGLISDELGAFLKSFNRYRSSGGDEEVMLTLFSGKSLSINRRSSAPILIENPFLSIIGSIQPKVLVNLLGNVKIDNGLTHRFLFSFPDNVKRLPLKDQDVPEYMEQYYLKLFKDIITEDFFRKDDFTSRTLGMSEEGFSIYKVFRREIDYAINNERRDAISGIYAKLDTYCIRIALIIEIMHAVCEGEKISYNISGASMERAVKLIHYFEQNALKVFQHMEKYRDPLSDYPQEHKVLYYQLPAEFDTASAWEVAKKSISRRTFYNILSDKYLFIKVKRGHYKKIW